MLLRVHRLVSAILLCTLALSVGTPALAQTRTSPVNFPAAGARTATLKDKITGDETLDFTLEAKAGMVLSVSLTSKNRQAYFNVLPAGSQDAIFIGPTTGTRFKGALPKDGTYVIRTFLMRAAARRNEKADIKLDIALTGGEVPAQTTQAAAPAAAAFDQTVELQGITFHVTSPNSAAGNSVTITPKGLAIDNAPVTVTALGPVLRAEAGDINTDGSPEIYVSLSPSAPDKPGSLIAFSTNNKKSMSQITVPELTANQAKGYRGGDEYALVENNIARRFPIYSTGANPKPTGKMRQLQYKLKAGEAAWVLKVDRVVEF